MAELDKTNPGPVTSPPLARRDAGPPAGERAGAADFEPVSVAKALLRATRAGTLATIDRNTGHPFASLVNVATDADGSPLILVSRLATHTANLEDDRAPRCCLRRAARAIRSPIRV